MRRALPIVAVCTAIGAAAYAAGEFSSSLTVQKVAAVVVMLCSILDVVVVAALIGNKNA